MRAKFINEKFTSDSDPIEDLNIGTPELHELNKKYREFGEMLKSDMKDLNFHEVILTTNELGNIIPCFIVLYFNQKYNLNIEMLKYWYKGMNFAKGTKNGYSFYFIISNSGMSVTINIYKGPGNFISRTPQCRSMQRLEKAFLKVCKDNNVKI
jgi:hypothetical protein